MDVTTIPQGIPFSAWIVAAVVALAFILRHLMPLIPKKESRVEEASSNAQVDIIDILQAQLKAALDRVAFAERQRDEAVTMVTNLKVELATLKQQLLTLERDLNRAQQFLQKELPDAAK